MKATIIAKLIELLLGMLSPELLKRAVDMILDIFEDMIAETENQLDDKIILPILGMIRETFNIPDED